MEITIAHTPDPDDSFMFYGMFEGKIKCNFSYKQVVKDIESLNKESVEAPYEVTAISANAFARVHDKYYLTTAGASFGISYGPIVVARNNVDLSDAVVGMPGPNTSAFLLYRMFAPEPKKFVELRFDQIVSALMKGEIDAGILIHDEQLTYQDRGLIKVYDLYEQWKKYAGDLPIPLGFNAIRKSLGRENCEKFVDDFVRSIKYGMEHESDAVQYSLQYARYQDKELETKFVRMYVNDLSIDMGEKGREALRKYYERAFKMNLLEPFEYEIL